MSAVVGCGRCLPCATGQELHCQLGSTICSGWHAEYIVVPSRTLRAVPPDVDAAVAAMMTGDPLGVPVRGMRRAASQPGDVVVVLGLGPVGMGHVLVRAYAGCHVIGVDPSAYRRDLALSVGAAAVYEPGGYKGRAALVIECSGQPSVIREAFGLAADGGVVLQSGECHVEVGIIPSEILIRREVSYIGSWYYSTEDYGMMCRLVAGGLPLARLLTHQVAAADAQGAISEFLDAKTGKVALLWNT
jgi:L-iditol 2-dehydrogenase